MNKNDLDKRICDCIEEAENTQTYREFIRQSEEWFDMNKANIDGMSEEQLKDYMDFLDYLWSK